MDEKEDSMLVKRIAAYPSTTAIARYWSETATFSLHLKPPLEFPENVWSSENKNHGATRQ